MEQTIINFKEVFYAWLPKSLPNRGNLSSR